MTEQAPDGPAAEHLGDRVSDRVAARLLDSIARGELTPGQRLPGERQLAEQMGVSRVSVRAALQRLKTQGFLAAVQGGGTRVLSSTRDMDPALTELIRVKLDNLYDLAEIRLVLEAWAAGRAARNATAEHLDEMGRTIGRMADPARLAQRGRDDMEFHLAVGKASGSPVYTHILSVIRETLGHMLDFHRHELFAADDDLTVLEHHRAVHAAIAARDPQRASDAMRAHLAWVLERYHLAGLGRFSRTKPGGPAR
ncbi:FadR/GntR family transcriptional regulator [Arenibaculum sp.]|uniref:FadR/GntR family transcriptional regulator n=1 Tax=Arenibaculum sp. TaxID=2865862 RepID=UPI002E1301A6|nr:FadR/GntR family transcriptional regulator [Arenibaculum sp.]